MKKPDDKQASFAPSDPDGFAREAIRKGLTPKYLSSTGKVAIRKAAERLGYSTEAITWLFDRWDIERARQKLRTKAAS